MNTKRIGLISIAVMACTLLTACDPPAAKEFRPEISGEMPEGLKDCKFYEVRSIIVTRCPLSITSTNYRSGKVTLNSAVVEADMEAERVKAESEKMKAKVAELERLLQEIKSSIGK